MWSLPLIGDFESLDSFYSIFNKIMLRKIIFISVYLFNNHLLTLIRGIYIIEISMIKSLSEKIFEIERFTHSYCLNFFNFWMTSTWILDLNINLFFLINWSLLRCLLIWNHLNPVCFSLIFNFHRFAFICGHVSYILLLLWIILRLMWKITLKRSFVKVGLASLFEPSFLLLAI